MSLQIQVLASTASGMSIEDVPAEVQSALESAYAEFSKRDNQEMRVAFPDKESALEFLRQGRAWAEGREAGKLTFRKLPRKTRPETEITFRLSRDVASGDGATPA